MTILSDIAYNIRNDNNYIFDTEVVSIYWQYTHQIVGITLCENAAYILLEVSEHTVRYTEDNQLSIDCLGKITPNTNNIMSHYNSCKLCQKIRRDMVFISGCFIPTNDYELVSW